MEKIYAIHLFIIMGTYFLKRQQQYFNKIKSMPFLWENREFLDVIYDRLTKVIDDKKTDSSLFDRLNLKYVILRDLNNLREELLILNKFDVNVVISEIKRVKSLLRQKEEEMDRKKKVLVKSKNYIFFKSLKKDLSLDFVSILILDLKYRELYDFVHKIYPEKMVFIIF